MADQRISIDASAGALDGTEIVPLIRVGSPVTAGSFVIGTAYVILTVGTTDFTAIGAASNTVGVGFVATGVGSGTGTAGATSNLRSTSQTIADLGGGGAAVPTSASTGLTTWANQGSAVVTDVGTGISLCAPSNANATNHRIRYKTAPSTPYAIKAKIAITSDNQTNHYAVFLFGWYDGTKLQGIGIQDNGSSNRNLDYTAVSGVAGTNDISSIVFPNIAAPAELWLCIINDASAIHLGYSLDGEVFFMLVEHSLPDYLSAMTNVFFGINPYDSIMNATMEAYQEFTNAGTVLTAGVRRLN